MVRKVFFLIFIGLVFSCEKESPLSPFSEGFCIQFWDSIVINHEEIDYYDFSTHMIYLKKTHDFIQDYNWKLANTSFSVYTNKEKKYSGLLFPSWSSSIPIGPYIDFPFMYPDYVIKISNRSAEYYTQGNTAPDPREDESIVNALKAYNQFHAGLSCSIDEIQFLPHGQLSFTFTIANNDTFNYYILSPDRMGLGLFHYFTNGLEVWNESTSWMQHKCSVEFPEPWDHWSVDWLDLIEHGEHKSYNIFYEDFDSIPAGQYQIFFYFSGLYNVDMEEIIQSNGRIWLGEIKATTVVVIE